jgi:isopentenyldiphosphate isomerase
VPPSDPSELLTRVTDDDSTVLGPVERRLVHGNPSLIHRSAHLLVLHPEDGTLLLQKRSPLKDTFPGRWDTSVGGHVSFGQSYEEAILREAREEIGVDLAHSSLERLHLLRFRGAEESENTTTFLCRHAGPFTPDPDEISELRFWTRAQIEAALGTETFTPHFEQEFATFLASPRASLLRG